ALLRRAIPALAAIHRAPATTPAERREWCALDRTAGRRLLLRRLHPFDPPRPTHEPRFGQVATIVVEPSTDRAENRFVAGVVRRLVAMCREAGEVHLPPQRQAGEVHLPPQRQAGEVHLPPQSHPQWLDAD